MQSKLSHEGEDICSKARYFVVCELSQVARSHLRGGARAQRGAVDAEGQLLDQGRRGRHPAQPQARRQELGEAVQPHLSAEQNIDIAVYAR